VTQREVLAEADRLRACGIDRVDAAIFAMPPLPEAFRSGPSTPIESWGARCAEREGRRVLVSNAPPSALRVRAVRALGASWIALLGAAIAVRPGYEPGDVVFVTDHLSWIGDNPLIGPNDDRIGPRFPDMTEVYSTRLRELGERAARGARIPVREGVLASLETPRAVTPAEGRMLLNVGADLVAASIVPAAILAVHAGLEVLALAIVGAGRTAAESLGDETMDCVEVVLRGVLQGQAAR
jgi:purine nucleoside phosphorylase